MKILLPFAAALSGVAAFPRILNNVKADTRTTDKSMDPVALRFAMEQTEAMYQKMEAGAALKRKRSPSQNQRNCGATPCLTFDEKDQYVSNAGEHAYAPPGPDEIRGPCPGLNAAANHAYLPRNGIASLTETIDGMQAMYNMAPDLSGFLAAYAIALDGDLITMTWSIGGPPPTTRLGSALLSPAQGISYSHNKYEGDASIARNDAFMADGDAHSLNVTKFRIAYESCLENGGLCTIDSFRRSLLTNIDDAIAENAHYFAPLFSTTLVVPAAYTFVLAFMSNHTAENTEGYLEAETLKRWFAVEGDYPNFVWARGQEQMPEAAWYRRPSISQYIAVNVMQDLITGFTSYPRSFRLGGNVAGPNTYVGVNPFDLTGGTYNIDKLFEGDNFGCLVFQSQEQAVPDQLKGLVSDLAPVLDMLSKYTKPILGSLQCPELAKYDSSLFDKYPGRVYSPTGPATNY